MLLLYRDIIYIFIYFFIMISKKKFELDYSFMTKEYLIKKYLDSALLH